MKQVLITVLLLLAGCAFGQVEKKELTTFDTSNVATFNLTTISFSQLVIFNSDDKRLIEVTTGDKQTVTVFKDGTVSSSDKRQIDLAAQAFWKAIGSEWSQVCKQIAEVR